AAVPVTFTVMVQELLAANEPPLRLMLFVACVAVMVPVQVVVSPFGVEMIRPPGSVSLKPMPLSEGLALAVETVKGKLVEPPSGMEAAPNALMSVGGPTTVSVAFAAALAPPSVELTITLLFFAPAVVPVTFTETAQLALVASVPPERLTVPEPAVAVA